MECIQRYFTVPNASMKLFKFSRNKAAALDE